MRSAFICFELTVCDASIDNLGLMPYRRRIVVVGESFHLHKISHILYPSSVGKPIRVEKCQQPTIDKVMRVQKMYIEELTRCVLRVYATSSPFSHSHFSVVSGIHTKTSLLRRD